MPFTSITRTSLELLDQNLRARGVAPGPLLPGRGDAAAPADPSFAVCEDFLRLLPFINVSEPAVARVYQVQVGSALQEPEFTARSGGTAWTPGLANGFGEELVAEGVRMKTIENEVRVDHLMSPDMREAQAILAEQSLLRSLAEAVLGSNPATDDNRELAGLPYYLPAGGLQSVAYDPAHKRRGALAQIISRVRPGDDGLGGGPDVVVTASQVIFGLVNELETLGVSPDYHHCPLTGKYQLHYMGVPVVEGRVPQPASATPATVAYALKVSGESGIRLFHHGGNEWGIVRGPVTTMATISPANEAVGATSGLSVRWTGALLVPDPRSLACARGIPLDPYA